MRTLLKNFFVVLIVLVLTTTYSLAKKKKAKVFSIVGRKDGYAYKHSNISMLIKVKGKKLLTPISESMQGVIWHFLVTDKRLQSNKTKW